MRKRDPMIQNHATWHYFLAGQYFNVLDRLYTYIIHNINYCQILLLPEISKMT